MALSLLALTGCSSPATDYTRQAAEKGYEPLLLQTDPFVLTAFRRAQAEGAPLVVYVEGDGRAWLNRNTPSSDPTPREPVGLRLALGDQGPNVAYLARPCQFPAKSRDPACATPRYWTSHRFADEVVASTSQAIDQLKAAGRATGVHLVGFSGGAAVAALVAARRDDVLSLRTVAGNLDHEVLNRLHGVSPMPASLNPADIAHRLVTLPQLHLIGDGDDVVPSAVVESFLERMGPSSCVHVQVLKGMAHLSPWEQPWPGISPVPTCR